MSEIEDEIRRVLNQPFFTWSTHFLSLVGLFTNLMVLKWLISFALRTLNVELMTSTRKNA